jgi:hypothetical protein
MAKGDLIRVPGYSQRVFYNGNIEYRNFSDNLVGNQSIVNIDNNNTESSSVFTMGNFVVTINTSNRTEYSFKSKNFSQFYNLNTLNFTNNISKIISDNVDIKLNLDNNKLSSYAYFGSAIEFIRVTLENVITYWPASLYLTNYLSTAYGGFSGNTVENYNYDAYNDKSKLDVNVLMIENNFDLVFTTNGDTSETFNEGNLLRDVTLNYLNYVILYNDIEYPILEFTGSTDNVNGYLNLVVEGDPFNDSTTTSKNRRVNFHIKPSKLKVDEFFNGLTSFEKNLLNRQTNPKYKSTYDYDIISDNNVIYKTTKSLVWPVSDGYNIDYSTNEYVEFISELIEIANNSDKASSDILTRFLVAESISNFDSLPKFDGTTEITSGQKMTKILKIYGRNFDEVKIWMDGLKSLNTVTYDKKNNTPDQLVKGLAKNLGWEMTTPISDNNLLSHYVETKQSTYSGQSTGLSSQETEIEMWRRLIINSAWLFKSKGSRKSIEFFFKFLGIPKGLVDLNEYIYRAKNKIDMDLFYKILERFYLDTDLTLYNVDADGYPKFPVQTNLMYFQNSGLWYRQTGGVSTSEHILTGNNPHIGPYDGGQAYLSQLHNLIPNFTAFTITNEVKISGSTNLFYNYNIGKINSYTGKTFINVLGANDIPKYEVQYNTNIIPDPFPSKTETSCGCPYEGNDDSLSVCLKDNYIKLDCNSGISKFEFISEPEDASGKISETPYLHVYTKKLYNDKGAEINQTYETVFRDKGCCILDGGTPYLYEKYVMDEFYRDSYETGFTGYTTNYFNTGYVCGKANDDGSDLRIKGAGCFITCQWRLPNTIDFGVSIIFFGSKWKKIDYIENNPNFKFYYIISEFTLDDISWTDTDNNRYLKFVTPKNTWGVIDYSKTRFKNGSNKYTNEADVDYLIANPDKLCLVGPPEYKYTNKSDSCFCDLTISDPQLVIDPVTNEIGYGCKLKKDILLNVDPNFVITDFDSPTYKTKTLLSNSAKFYADKSLQKISCAEVRS